MRGEDSSDCVVSASAMLDRFGTGFRSCPSSCSLKKFCPAPEGTLWQSIKEEGSVELYEVTRTTSAVRHFTNDPLPDETKNTILVDARLRL